MCSGRAAQQLQDELEKRYPEIMSPRLAGQYLGVHFTTIYRYMRAGVLKAAQADAASKQQCRLHHP